PWSADPRDLVPFATRRSSDLRPDLYEYQVQAAMEYVWREAGSRRNGYPSIVASGPNACILHYVENDRRIEDGDLVLIDAAAEVEDRKSTRLKSSHVKNSYAVS